MKVINKKQFVDSLGKIKNKVFVYPTDTIYGIGCIATDVKAVKRVRSIKQRREKPFSVIAPSKKWIRENCVVSSKVEKWIAKLPGKYTLILELKNKKCISKEVNKGMKTIGVRIPKHWISGVVAKLGKPLVTTSVNITDEKFITCIEDIDPKIAKKVDFVVDVGKLNRKPSVLVDLIKGKIKKR